MKKKASDPSEPLLEVLDHLLGPIEGQSPDELADELMSAGIDVVAARDSLYARVSEIRSKLWEAQRDVTSDMSSLLLQLRPHHLQSNDPKVAEKLAARWVRDLVDCVKPIGMEIEFATAARSLDGPMSASDEDVMRELQDSIRSRQRQGSD